MARVWKPYGWALREGGDWNASSKAKKMETISKVVQAEEVKRRKVLGSKAA